MKRKTVLIILVIFICCILGILVNHIQQKITSQQIETAAGKNVASSKKLASTKKNGSGTNSNKIQVSNPSSTNNTRVGENKSKVEDNPSANTSKNTTDSKVASSSTTVTNSKNDSKNIASVDKKSQVNSSVNNTEQPNFSIIDHEDSSKNYSSHENLEGMSVADITISVLKRQDIYIQYTNSITGIYVSDINHEHEKSKGPSSGWVYYVNGKKASVGASSYKLNSGDKLEWQFWADAINN